MLIENRPAAGEHAARRLEEAGFAVHRCHDADSSGFPCRGVGDSEQCPVTQRVDVAVIARHRIAPRPSALESGVQCAIRAGIPLVEDGSDLLDPFAAWITVRSGEDVAAACHEAIELAHEPLRRDLWMATSPAVDEAGQDPTALGWQIDVSPIRLHLVATGPQLGAGPRARIAVRALDVARHSPFARDRIDVSYIPTS